MITDDVVEQPRVPEALFRRTAIVWISFESRLAGTVLAQALVFIPLRPWRSAWVANHV